MPARMVALARSRSTARSLSEGMVGGIGPGNQLNDRYLAPGLGGPAAVIGELGEDAIGQLPESPPLTFIGHHHGAEGEATVGDVGVLAKVVVPARILGPPLFGGDERDAIAIVEVEGCCPAQLSRPRPARLEQPGGDRPPGAEPPTGEPQEVRVELPGDLRGGPRTDPGGGERADSEIETPSSRVRIDVAEAGYSARSSAIATKSSAR